MGTIGFHGMHFNACDCAGMLMNACIAFSIWHVGMDKEFHMIFIAFPFLKWNISVPVRFRTGGGT